MKLTPKEIIEKETWNEFLKKTDSGHLFQAFEWGIFKESQRWRCRRIALQTSVGETKAALSILEKTVPLIGYKIWYLPRGPVLDFQDRATFEETVDFLIDSARKSRVMALKISPDVVLNENTKWIQELLENKGFKETADYQLHKCTIRLNLQDDLEKIFSNFKKNTRWEINKAGKDGILVRKAESVNDLKIFYRLYSEAMGKGKLSYGYFKNIWEVFQKNVLVLIAFHQEEPLSAVFIALFNKKCWYLFGGSTRKHPTRNSGQFLQWETIKQAKGRGAEVYDLQGIPCGEPKTPHDKGVLQFKEGFGGEKVELIGEFDYVFSPFLFKMLRKLNQARIITRGMTGRV